MKFEVIEVVGQEGSSCGKLLERELGAFTRNHSNAKVLFMTQGSFILKMGNPCTILTICYDEPAKSTVRTL